MANVQSKIGIANVICSFAGLTKEEWEQLRASHYGLNHFTIGGSDVGVIMGVNKWKDLPQLFLEKMQLIDIPVDNEAVEWGNILEPVIAEKFASVNYHMEVTDIQCLLQHPDVPSAVANIDRLLYNRETGEYGILEIKTASEYVKSDWDNGIPPSYYAQLQWYMWITGIQWGYFAVLIGGNKYHQVEVQRNDEYIHSMIFQVELFIDRLNNNIPPELTGSKASETIVKHLFPYAEDEKTVFEFDDEVGVLIGRRAELKEAMSLLEEELKEAENKIKFAIGEHKKGQYGSFNVSYGNTKGRTTFDAKRFEQDHPEIYKEYITQGADYRTLRVTEKKVK